MDFDQAARELTRKVVDRSWTSELIESEIAQALRRAWEAGKNDYAAEILKAGRPMKLEKCYNGRHQAEYGICLTCNAPKA